MYPILMAKKAVKHNIIAKVTGVLPRFLPSLPEHWFWRKSCRAAFPKLHFPGKTLTGNVKSSDGKICGNTASCPSLETNNVLHHTGDLENNNRQISLTLFKWQFPNWFTHGTLLTSLVAQMVKNLAMMQGAWVWSWVRKIPWRREWQPTPVILPRESHGQRSLAGYSPWGHKELDTTEWLTHIYYLALDSKWLSGYYSWKNS